MWRTCAVVFLLGWFGAPASAQCTTNAAETVDVLYGRFLERHPDAGSQQLIQQLASGHVTVRDAVAAIAKSPEHVARLWAPIVDAAFRQVRNAPPESDRVTDIVHSLARGSRTLDDVTLSLAVEETASLSPDTAVVALYKRLLGRDPSPEDIDRQSRTIKADGVEPVARTIVTSQEYRERFGRNGVPGQGAAAYERSVRALYRELFDRDQDAEGLARSTALATQSGFAAVIDQILASAEYQRLFGPQGIPGAPEGRSRYCGVP